MELYHDFSALDLAVPQRGGIYRLNQAAKAPIITGYLLFAIGKLRSRNKSPLTVAELFCADAYYSFLASRFGADRCYGFDNDSEGFLSQARYIRALIKDHRVELRETEIANISPDFRASIVLNTGGLYHVQDPLRYVEQSYAMAESYLILQSVISIATEDETYFQAPAPGWTWGCRFTYGYLAKELRKRGYNVVDSERNLLLGNDRPEDRGSAYFLIAK